ncbi:hypothetical protein FACS1894160_2240 [Bacteroidia bacterium]|nr:hypothetical protein FACS1894123_09250 [Bacteroidia bacterium]GHV08250.1 hypothetical protein FACS1894160_2240 [Bacteroidia bacterium]
MRKSIKPDISIRDCFLVLVCCLPLSSCWEKDQVDYGLDQYYVEIATVLSKAEFLLDNGKKIIAETPSGNNIQTDDRVLLNYTLLPETTAGYDQTIRINGLAKLPVLELISTTQKNIDALPEEPVYLESLWIGSHYLNLKLAIDHNSIPHTLNLLTDSIGLKNNIVWIYLKHDKNNDSQGYQSPLLLSVDLKKILGEPKNKKTLLVHINAGNYKDQVYNLKY